MKHSKSYVTMEQNVCVVCAKPFDTGAILLDKRMRDKFESNTITDLGMCEEHQKLKDEGYIALVECDESKSGCKGKSNCALEEAYRTSNIAHIKKAVFEKMFDIEIPENGMCFIDEEAFKQLENLVQKGE